MSIHPITRRTLLLAALAAAASPPARAQSWPTRPIKLVTPFSAGGPGDDIARLVAEGLAKGLGQPVIADNRPGAGGVIGANAVARAAPDGYTLLAAANGTLTNALIRTKLPYAAADLVPVTGVAASPSLIVVHPGVNAHTLKELQAVAKADRAGMFFATTGIGSTSHFAGEMIKASLGVPLTLVQYKSGGESVLAFLGQQVQILSDVPSGTLVELVKSGKARPLAVAGDQRLAALPDVPTTTEAGFPGIRMYHWLGLLAPRGTPPAVLDRVNAEVQAYIATDAMRKELDSRNSVAMKGDRAAFTRFIDDENRRLGKIARDLHIVAD